MISILEWVPRLQCGKWIEENQAWEQTVAWEVKIANPERGLPGGENEIDLRGKPPLSPNLVKILT